MLENEGLRAATVRVEQCVRVQRDARTPGPGLCVSQGRVNDVCMTRTGGAHWVAHTVADSQHARASTQAMLEHVPHTTCNGQVRHPTGMHASPENQCGWRLRRDFDLSDMHNSSVYS